LKTCVVRYQGCGDPSGIDYDPAAAECYIYTQTPAAGEEAADWDPRVCLNDSDYYLYTIADMALEGEDGMAVASGIYTIGDDGDG
jgi:hypothetical protein